MYQKLLILFIIIGYLCDKYKFDAVVTVNDLGINKTSNGKRVVSDNNEVKTLINSRYTNPCSINEYQSCYCDYKIVNLNLYSITINCQFKSNDYDSSTKISYHHHHHQHQHQHDSIQLLQQQQQPHNDYSLNLHIKYIPRINTTNYNYINSINYLDLSKTLINEIQTDAFHVSFYFRLFFLFCLNSYCILLRVDFYFLFILLYVCGLLAIKFNHVRC